jgi:23S rRNA (adenine1618-N6)-methyltransferase
MPSPVKNDNKNRMHPRNRNLQRYDLDVLTQCVPELAQYCVLNKLGDNSIDFSNPTAVRLLNKALLQHYYGVENWVFPSENLCPPIPGRADYLHYVADLLALSNFGKIPKGSQVKCLDIGVGASCIYPIIGAVEYGWQFLGSDINEASLNSAEKIIASNASLIGKINFDLQRDPASIFHGTIDKNEQFDITICNPPFHASAKEAQESSRRKVQNLSGKKVDYPTLNFAGTHDELICAGGEIEFIKNMIGESKRFAKNCFWFTTLVSKQSNMKALSELLNELKAKEIKSIPMGTGNKSTRILAWTFLTKEEQKNWLQTRWTS